MKPPADDRRRRSSSRCSCARMFGVLRLLPLWTILGEGLAVAGLVICSRAAYRAVEGARSAMASIGGGAEPYADLMHDLITGATVTLSILLPAALIVGAPRRMKKQNRHSQGCVVRAALTT